MQQLRNRYRVVLGGLIATTLVILQLGSGCTYEEPTNKIDVQTYPTSEATNATTEFLTGSVVTTRLHSGRFIQYAEKDSAWAYVLHVDFYDSSGVHASTLTCDSALVREGQRLMEGFGSVHVVTDKGTTLESPHLAWNDSSQTVSTDSFVVVTRGEDVMSGYGFQSDPDLTRIVFRRQVSGRIAEPEALDEQ